MNINGLNRKRMFVSVLFAIFVWLIFSVMLSSKANASEVFKGSGTENAPYLIRSADDLIKLAESVNKDGNDYRDQYFVLENDIDLSGIDFKPIGVFESDHYFYGILDGNGYAVKNITIKGSGNNGLFGVLGGTVINLEVNGGTIEGDCCGVICSHAAESSALILNCKSTNVTVNAFRTGGIADNFVGSIINCVSENCKLNGTVSFGGISSFAAVNSCGNYYSYIVDSDLDAEEITINGSEKLPPGKEQLSDVVFHLNGSSRSYGVIPSKFFGACNMWRLKDGKIEIDNLKFPEGIIAEFSGTGTSKDPYLIASADDLLKFRDAVNGGNDFKNQYFALINDIDLSGIDFIPIGVYGSNHYFFGTFDGNGYAVKNLSIKNSGNNGFFGMLGGTVVNLEVNGGTINGDCCGAISSHAINRNALILNCKSTNVTVNGYRTGGIADNFIGSIINCVSDDCKLNGTISFGGISSYDVREAFGNYYSIGGSSVTEAKEIIVDGSEELSSGDSSKETADHLNTNYRHHIVFPVNSYGICNIWEAENGKLILTNDKQSKKFVEAVSEFSGSGTLKDPYLIDSSDDLVKFRDAVNSGYDFYGEYVRQTSDIDLSDELWTPIGLYNSGNYFFGIYNGAGLTINNLYTIELGNNGFFGKLGGSVYNLGIESGVIKGSCCGAISSHSCSNSALIVNCYNKADVVGIRAGGLVDNFSGSVIGCWSDCTLNSEIVGGIASYSANDVRYCFTSCAETVPETMGGKMVECFSGMDFSDAGSKEILNSIRKNLPDIKKEFGNKIDLYKFAIKDSKLVFSRSKYKFDFTLWVGNNIGIVVLAIVTVAIYLCLLLKVGPKKFYKNDRNWIKRFSLVFCPFAILFYMFFIHSPIEFFLGNNSELEFVISDFAPRFIVLAIVGTVAVSAPISLLKGVVIDIIACAVLGLDLAMYIQYTYLNRSLGLLDGTEKTENILGLIVNLVVWIALIIMPFILFFVLKAYRGKIIMGICAALGVIQISGLIWLVARSPKSAFEHNNSKYIVSGNDQYTVSSKDNIIILVVDTYCNDYLDMFFEEYPELTETVKDFTRYNNTDCHYEGSVFSVNYIASGTEWDTSVKINEWCESAWDNEKNNRFYSGLSELGYISNIYTGELGALSDKALSDASKKISNIVKIEYDFEVNNSVMFKSFINANLYRFAPKILKHEFEFTKSDFSKAYEITSKNNKDIYTNRCSGNADFYQDLLSKRLKIDDRSKYYIIQHLEGVHGPYKTNEQCKKVDKATLLEAERGCWRYIQEYIDQLKKLGVYNNSTIIITADHGKHHDYHSAQPMFFIKTPNESHDRYAETNAPISFTDLMPTVMYLAGGEYSDLGTTIFDHTEGEKRERTLYVRMYDKELPDVPKKGSGVNSILNCFYKYVYTGDAKDLETLGADGPTEKILWKESFY